VDLTEVPEIENNVLKAVANLNPMKRISEGTQTHLANERNMTIHACYLRNEGKLELRIKDSSV
jgi:hypothetical protein